MSSDLTRTRTLTIESEVIPEYQGHRALVATKVEGREGINELFSYDVTLKTPGSQNFSYSGGTDFDLDAWIGREAGLRIELEESWDEGAGQRAGVREINGLITQARFLREEGRHVFYQMTLKPWLHLATLTSDCKIFQDMTVVETLDALLSDYVFPVEKRLTGEYPKRDYQTQYNETDHVFFCRLCEEWGIHWFFEHENGTHRLVLIDDLVAYRKNAGAAYREILFHALGDKIDEEHIYAFVPARRLTPGRYVTRDYDYTRPKSELQVIHDDPRPTAHNGGEIYDWHAAKSGGSHYAQPKAGAQQAANQPEEEGRRLALLRMDSLRSPGHRAQGAGQLRGLLPGHIFTLHAHPSKAANGEYLTISTHFILEEVAQETQSNEPGAGRSVLQSDALRNQQWRVEVEFEAHPLLGEPFHLPVATPKPHTRGPHVALVTGGPDNVWTDYLGRIKVQFPWDRYGQKNENSSCWVRVSSPWAGNQLGGIHLPRIGQEVIIDFIGGDPDLPICIGRVHNEMNLPPWELPGQQALSGFRSRELAEGLGNAAIGRSNHLVMDDTAQEIQLKLRSDHQASELTLGYNTRIETNAGREEKRGEGYELRTDGHGALRAAAGLLISTQARNDAEAHALSTDETQERLTRAQIQHRQLGEYAQRHQAQEREADQSQISDAIKAQNEAIRGTGDLGELTEPHLLLASSSGIEGSAKESIHLHSGEHTAITAERDLSHSVGRSWHAAVQEKLTIFIHRLGARIIAAMGLIRVEAEGDELQLLGQKTVTLQSHEDWVNITGKKGVLINGGGSYLKLWPGGIEHGTKDGWIVYAKSHGFAGPKSMTVTGRPAVCEECLEKAAREAAALKARE
jgi:type VI secretion system secreted protein VgrG